METKLGHPAAQILEAYPELETIGAHAEVKNILTRNEGTGLQLPAELGGIVNAILIGYKMTPPGIYSISQVKFDITRRMDADYTTKDKDGNVIDPAGDQSWTHHLPFPDKHPDAANDDPDWASDESHIVDSKDRMYVFDGPGFPDKIALLKS